MILDILYLEKLGLSMAIFTSYEPFFGKLDFGNMIHVKNQVQNVIWAYLVADGANSGQLATFLEFN